MGTVVTEAGVNAPGKKQTPMSPPEQALESPRACNTDCDGVPGAVPQKEEDPTGEESLFSLTDHLEAIGSSNF